jgi:hypothetical protein
MVASTPLDIPPKSMHVIHHTIAEKGRLPPWRLSLRGSFRRIDNSVGSGARRGIGAVRLLTVLSGAAIVYLNQGVACGGVPVEIPA